jgi:hypothetical protein
MEKIDKVYNIYLLIKNGEIDTAKNEIKNVDNYLKNNLNNNLKNIKGLLSLKLRLFILDKNLDEICNLFDNNEMMSRDWVDLLIFSNNDSFGYILNKYLDKLINVNFNDKNITDLYNNLTEYNFCSFIKNFVYKQLVININGNNNECKNNYFLDSILILQIEEIKKKIKLFNIFNNFNYKYVLDGGNILYSNNGKINNLSYNKLLKFYNLHKNESIIILNKKHFNIINKNPKFKNVNILYTPFNINDDLYILYYSLINKAFIITNDEYSDHIDNYSIKLPNLNFLKVYLDEKLIKYNNNIINVNIYSKVVQIIDDVIYIPCKKNYICVKYKN